MFSHLLTNGLIDSDTPPSEPTNGVPNEDPGLPRVCPKKVPLAVPMDELKEEEPSGKLPAENAADT